MVRRVGKTPGQIKGIKPTKQEGKISKKQPKGTEKVKKSVDDFAVKVQTRRAKKGSTKDATRVMSDNEGLCILLQDKVQEMAPLLQDPVSNKAAIKKGIKEAEVLKQALKTNIQKNGATGKVKGDLMKITTFLQNAAMKIHGK